MATASLNAKPRSTVGKGNARKLRAQGQVPAVIYGHGRSPLSLALDTRELERLLATTAISTTVVELAFDGTTARTLIREVQRHPVKQAVLHVDFQELVAGEKVIVRVPLIFTGTAEGVKNGGVLEEVMHELEIRVDPSNIPNHIDIDVTPLTIGHGVHVQEIRLPAGVEAISDGDATVCTVVAPRTTVEEAPAAAEAEAVAEPELIRKPKAEEGGEQA